MISEETFHLFRDGADDGIQEKSLSKQIIISDLTIKVVHLDAVKNKKVQEKNCLFQLMMTNVQKKRR